MKNYSIMRKLVLLMCGLLAATLLSAQAVGDLFTIDNINYTVINVDSSEVEVSGFADISAGVDTLIIPGTVIDPSNEATYSVVSIGEGAFSCNSAANKGGGNELNNVIETVILDASVDTIGAHAFRQNANLKSINLDHISTLGSNVFVICSSLSDIGSLDELKSTGGYTFYQCHMLETIEMPNVVTLATGEVYDMDGITQFNIPSTVTTIGQLFLGRCELLTTVQVNWTDTADVVIEATNFFRGVVLADGAVTLYVPVGTKDMYAAHSLWGQIPDANIIEGTLPAVGDVFAVDNINYTITSIDSSEVEVSGLVSYDDVPADLVIAATVSDLASNVYDVVAIGEKAFMSSAVISKVTLPESVTTLKLQSFNASSITEINLENVVYINKKAFAGCLSLVDVGGVLSNCIFIGDYAFNQCFRSTLTFDFPVLEEMGTGSIYDSNSKGTSITKLNIPSSLNSTGTLFFGGHNNLAYVQVNWTAAELDSVAFADTDKFFRWLDLSTITLYINGDVADSAAYAEHALWGGFDSLVIGTLPVTGDIFSDNNIDYLISSEYPNELTVLGFTDSADATVIIPEFITYSENSVDYSVVSIAADAFTSEAITTVSLPTTVTEIGDNAFKSCSSLTSINLESVDSLGSASFASCSALTSVGVLTNVTSLGDYAFYLCTSLTTLETPSVVTIGSGSLFVMDALSNLNIPSTVTSIGSYFLGASSATAFSVDTIFVNWEDTLDVTIDPMGFVFGVDLSVDDLVLVVPVGKESMYEEHSLWGQIPDSSIVDLYVDPSSLVTAQEDVLSLYPNPTETGVITIGGEANKMMNVCIYSVSGAKVFEKTVLSQEPISTGLSSGIYMLRVDNAFVQKFVVR